MQVSTPMSRFLPKRRNSVVDSVETRIELKSCFAQESIKRTEDIYGQRYRALIFSFTVRVQNREGSTLTTLQIEDCVLNIPNASISSRKLFGDSHGQSATRLYTVIEAGVMTDVKGRITLSLPFSETHSSVDRAIGELILTDTRENRFTLPFDVPLSRTASG